MKFLIYFGVFFVIALALDKEVVEDLVKGEVKDKAVAALHESRQNEKTRICTCKEFDVCIEKARMQANQCFTPCYDEFAKLKLLEKPELLKGCISEKEKLLDQVLPCVKENLDACSEKKSSEKASNVDLDTLISKVEEDVDHRAQTLLRTVKSKDLDKLATATKSYFMCFKNCFINVKNPNGFCHEQIGCALDITDHAVNKTINVCGSKIDWAKELGDVCSCAEKAGLGLLHDYCAMLDEFSE